MSKIKSPQDKKKLGLKKDRRNVYGENDKASRKNIPRSKQISHQEERRSANEILRGIKSSSTEDDIANIELEAAVKTIDKKQKGFKKVPDEPLAKILKTND